MCAFCTCFCGEEEKEFQTLNLRMFKCCTTMQQMKHTGSCITATNNRAYIQDDSVFSLFPSVDYFSDESSSSGTSSNAGGGESDSDSSYCPTSDSCESETVVKESPVLGSIVIHPLVLQFIEPTERPSCSKRPESVGPVLWSNPAVIPNRVGFVRLSQIGVFVRGCKTQGCDGNLVPVAVKSTRLGGGLSVFFGCDGCKVKLAIF